MLWFPLVVLLALYSAAATLDYILDLKALYQHPKATKLHREAAWSNLRNEIGRLLIAQLFFVLGVNAATRLPMWVMFLEFFGIANYKLYCSVKDRRLRLIVLESQQAVFEESGGGG